CSAWDSSPTTHLF
nr:immunoglobulin light chain junction region [Macaca mulatta]